MDAPKDYTNFIGSIKERIRSAQYDALKAVNRELVGLYWDIGKMISEKQIELGWGKSVVKNLSSDIALEFPNIKGFSVSNIWYMSQFYQEYGGNEKLESLIREIGWTHNLLIFKKCKTIDSREFYIKQTKRFGWTTRVLDHQIDNKTYEKFQLGQTNYDNQYAESFRSQRCLAIKDHYTFDFLELSEKHSERELESSIIRNIQGFLLELGGEMALIGSQYKLEVGGEEFYIDLLLYHRELQCLVAIELKAGKFKPEYQGKMEFYLNVLNDLHKKPNENEAIGIIICKEKNRVVVEYSLRKTQNPIGIASYSTGPELPEYYKLALPSIEQIERGLDRVDLSGF